MHRNKVFAAMLAILMVVSLTACGRESAGTPGGELENGVAPDSWFSHLAVEVPGENCRSQWCEPVSEEEYRKLK